MTIYEAVIKNKIEFSTHKGDLYIPDTPDNWELLKQYHSQFIGNVRRFVNQSTGDVWLDIPFANDEFWEQQTVQEHKGIFKKYILKRTDGTPINPKNKYFVLKYEGEGDKNHIQASRKALMTYAKEIEEYLPELAKDLKEVLKSKIIDGKCSCGGFIKHYRDENAYPYGGVVEYDYCVDCKTVYNFKTNN